MDRRRSAVNCPHCGQRIEIVSTSFKLIRYTCPTCEQCYTLELATPGWKAVPVEKPKPLRVARSA